MGYSRQAWMAAGAAVLPLAGAALYLLLNYDALPDPYPRHWNWRGVADAFGPKSEGAVLAVPLIGVVALGILLAAVPAQSHDAAGKRPISSNHFIALAWFVGLVFSLVSLLPVIVPPSGAPWLLLVVLAGAAAVCAIGIRDSRRAKRGQAQEPDGG
jgi:uncharacterized membrane protein